MRRKTLKSTCLRLLKNIERRSKRDTTPLSPLFSHSNAVKKKRAAKNRSVSLSRSLPRPGATDAFEYMYLLFLYIWCGLRLSAKKHFREGK